MSWFDAAEICKVIGLSNTAKALERLDDDEMLVDRSRLLNESGLYHLVLQCELPKASEFAS